MPIANYQQYCEMLDRAHAGRFAYPAINICNIDTVNAAIEGFARAQSDGIVQVGISAAEFASGELQDAVVGAVSLAEHARRVAAHYGVYIALHTDHCVSDKVESFLLPLLDETERRRQAGLPNLFNSHMYDGSELPLAENMARAVPLLERCWRDEIVLEVETGAIGGEEEGIKRTGMDQAKFYTTPVDMIEVYEALSRVEGACYMLAATFGNVHGVYKPGNVVLRPEILKEGQDAVVAKYGDAARFLLVFHGGSGTAPEDIRRTLEYGVVKMNVDTDTQYAFTRPVVDHILTNYAGVLKIEGEVGDKKTYDPRAWLARARDSMAVRVARACEDLHSAGQSMGP